MRTSAHHHHAAPSASPYTFASSGCQDHCQPATAARNHRFALLCFALLCFALANAAAPSGCAPMRQWHVGARRRSMTRRAQRIRTQTSFFTTGAWKTACLESPPLCGHTAEIAARVDLRRRCRSVHPLLWAVPFAAEPSRAEAVGHSATRRPPGCGCHSAAAAPCATSHRWTRCDGVRWCARHASIDQSRAQCSREYVVVL